MGMQGCVCSCAMAKVGIIGASGYTGAELLRLAALHPELEVVVATGDTQAGTLASALYPSLAAAYPDLVFTTYDPEDVAGLDLVFLGLPHGEAQAIVPRIRHRVGRIVDLAADFRLKDAALYPKWYGEDHSCPDLLAEAAYGLPELFRDEIRERHPRRHARLLRHRSFAGPGATRACRPDRAQWHHRGRRVGCFRRRPRSQAQHHVLRSRRGLRRVQPSRPPPHARDRAGRRGHRAVHAALRADEPRHPRHLLCPSGRHHLDGGIARRARPCLSRRAVRGRAPDPAVDEGDAWAPTPRTSRRASTTAPVT